MRKNVAASAKIQLSQIQSIYEKHPYPAADDTVLTKKRWNLAPMEWIMALWRPEKKDSAPERILVAGCGTGSEAFMLARKFPQATIVAVDFSPRSISIAQSLRERAPAMRNITFHVGDLANRNLRKIIGGTFDFISCHGVLSYSSAPARVLSNLRHQLKPDGALYLGVNGSDHFSVRGRPFLSAFGFDMTKLRDEPYLRKLLKLWDSVLNREGDGGLARKSVGYLAGDLFGPTIQNLSLSSWLRVGRQAGLHFCNSYSCWRTLRSVMEKDCAQLFMPRSRPEICEMLDIVSPETFHRLLFTDKPAWNPPWESTSALVTCRPVMTNLYSVRPPKQSGSRRALRRVRFESPPLNTRLDWQMPEWELEILRQSDGKRTLDSILRNIATAVPQKLLRQQLYILHQLLVISLMPIQRRDN